ncbi:26S proteasome non-ATPase regulatory subunit 4 [Tanacetum coccineum]
MLRAENVDLDDYWAGPMGEILLERWIWMIIVLGQWVRSCTKPSDEIDSLHNQRNNPRWLAAQERIMVCVDNFVSSIKFASQVDAIQLYCHAKLKSNPKTAVGVVAMAIHCLQQFGRALDTTSDLDEIMDCVKAIARGGELDFVGGITFAELYLRHYHPHICRELANAALGLC